MCQCRKAARSAPRMMTKFCTGRQTLKPSTNRGNHCHQRRKDGGKTRRALLSLKGPAPAASTGCLPPICCMGVVVASNIPWAESFHTVIGAAHKSGSNEFRFPSSAMVQAKHEFRASCWWCSCQYLAAMESMTCSGLPFCQGSEQAPASVWRNTL